MDSAGAGALECQQERDEMAEHRIGTREEWQAAREELAHLEAEQAQRSEEIKRKRLDLPWVRVEKEYEFDTEDGRKTLAALFDGRSQLLAYNAMFGPDYTLGACPGCTSLADGLDGALVHLNHRDVTLLCFSRAPIDRLTAYKQRMSWQFPYVSTYNTDFAFDFGLALTEEQAGQIPEIKEMIDNPPEWLRFWSKQIGAELKDGLRENPSWIEFALENGIVYHTYSVAAPDPFVARTSIFCSIGRRSSNPVSRSVTARTNTRTEGWGWPAREGTRPTEPCWQGGNNHRGLHDDRSDPVALPAVGCTTRRRQGCDGRRADIDPGGGRRMLGYRYRTDARHEHGSTIAAIIETHDPAKKANEPSLVAAPGLPWPHREEIEVFTTDGLTFNRVER
jgi:predicted dithiol-disulfide oxidoreductase (DUF899 family)